MIACKPSIFLFSETARWFHLKIFLTTTLVLIVSDVFQMYQSATGDPDESTGLLTITSVQYSNLKSIIFVIWRYVLSMCRSLAVSNIFFLFHQTQFELTSNTQVWPGSLNSAIGGTAGGIYLIVRDSSSDNGSGQDQGLQVFFLSLIYLVFVPSYLYNSSWWEDTAAI